MFLHNFAFDDPEVFSSKPKIEVKVKVKSVKDLFVLTRLSGEVRDTFIWLPLGWVDHSFLKVLYLTRHLETTEIMFETKCNSEDRKMQSCYGGKGARVVNTRRNGILINFPVEECLVNDTRQAVGSRQGGLYRAHWCFAITSLKSSNKSYHVMKRIVLSFFLD